MIEVNHCHNCDGFHLECNEVTVATSTSEGMMKRMARILSRARDLPSRMAVKLLGDELGLEEERSLDLLMVLHGERAGSRLQ